MAVEKPTFLRTGPRYVMSKTIIRHLFLVSTTRPDTRHRPSTDRNGSGFASAINKGRNRCRIRVVRPRSVHTAECQLEVGDAGAPRPPRGRPVAADSAVRRVSGAACSWWCRPSRIPSSSISPCHFCHRQGTIQRCAVMVRAPKRARNWTNSPRRAQKRQ